MITKIIAVFLIFIFIVLIAIAVWAFVRLNKMGLLSTFMQGQWLGSLLSGLFVILFIGTGIAMLMQVEWAMPVMCYTIYGWLIYVWLYGLNKILKMVVLLKTEEAKSVSQLMGRSKLFDELIEKTIAMTRESQSVATEVEGDAHAVTDSEWENLINDEDWFKEVFPYALRKKIKRKVIGLLVHTAIFVVILILIR